MPTDARSVSTSFGFQGSKVVPESIGIGLEPVPLAHEAVVYSVALVVRLGMVAEGDEPEANIAAGSVPRLGNARAYVGVDTVAGLVDVLLHARGRVEDKYDVSTSQM